MSAAFNLVRTSPRRALFIVANPTTSTTTGWPVGFWASELAHPYHELTEAGWRVEIASPRGGKVEVDAYSDPRHDSGYSAHDFLSLGFLSSPPHVRLLEATTPVASCDAASYDALVVVGGQSPMFTFRTDAGLQRLIADAFAHERVVAALCHGVAALLDVRLADGSWLLQGRTVTGFSNGEEDLVDALSGTKVMPFRIQDEAHARGANFVCAAPWRPFAVRDGRLITGQQQYSGAATARLVLEAAGA
jgi:putative intracellular protease/amidase